MTDDFYDLLEVPRDASQDEIKEAFREKVQEYHPDLNDDPRAQAQFTALKKAYDTLGDPAERDAYERLGHEDYVAKRINGLPSQEKWATDDEESAGEDDDGAATTGRDRGGATSGGTASTGAGTGTASTTGPGGATGSHTDPSGTSTNESSGASGRSARTGGTSTASGRTDAGRAETSGSDGSTTTATTGTTSQRTSTTGETASVSGGSSETAATSGTAGGTASASSSTTESRSSTTGAGLLDSVRTVHVGWPHIVAADAVYVAGVALYFATILGRLRSVAAAARTAVETKAFAPLRAELATSTEAAFTAFFYGTEYVASVSLSAKGGLLVLGSILLPLVYGISVRRTRRWSTAWNPTRLYVLAALAPLIGIGAHYAGIDALAVEVVALGLLPLGAVVLLPLSAFVRPKVKNLLFS